MTFVFYNFNIKSVASNLILKIKKKIWMLNFLHDEKNYISIEILCNILWFSNKFNFSFIILTKNIHLSQTRDFSARMLWISSCLSQTKQKSNCRNEGVHFLILFSLRDGPKALPRVFLALPVPTTNTPGLALSTPSTDFHKYPSTTAWWALLLSLGLRQPGSFVYLLGLETR